MSMQTHEEEPILRIKNLQTSFFTDKEVIRAVDGISFDIGQAETVGIVGESGSGKSVTARSIMGLVESPGRTLRGSSIQFRDAETVERFANTYTGKTVDIGKLEEQADLANVVQDAMDQHGAQPHELTDHEKYADLPPEQVNARQMVADGAVGWDDVIAAGYADELNLIDSDDFIFVEEGRTSGDGVRVDRGYLDVTRASERELRRLRGGNIAMVFQDPLSSLNPVYTVGNQIEEALSLHQGLQGQAATQEAVNLLEAVGIPDARRRVREYPHQFSGGMRQRAVIAMALACEPELLICDEPTTALDVTIQAQILELLEEIQEDRGLSIMFITHDMGVIADISDRVNVMYAGEIVETADAESLFDRPKHPYTQGLLSSIPGRQEGDRLVTIEGDVPTPNEEATYCRFAPRCPEAFDECQSVHPESVSVGQSDTTHTASCLLYPEDVPQAEALEIHRAKGGNGGGPE
ncbi:ABC transporter ATP-binding protein [Haloarchaeobius litoreus]|uniref:Nickel import system ATP-binding protein NikD n=1 Tax=Haloarchaeobius litoreus TaxID=755306 RepID=A0ABD6DKB0_9EURY|nr:ABC transporter ATP-binding protein [Haloarchaeobius litoreus]